ncbi:hypothetical protein NDU88_000608 [Pleurodeles waltl]|uniref:Uncharacterized protein n=1 Tax=Pleurodeles waltl TaxID=8319 RepID=A0AAV7S898_PLEWA|nr:hypothetical protein NDU88_000608 [Pleurodeles waltl]
MAQQRLGRPAGSKGLPVRVGAPFGHRIEGRVKPGAVHLTSRKAAGLGVGSQDTCSASGVLPFTSRGAGSNLEHIEDELLDYDEEEEAHEVAVQTGGTVETPKVIKRAVQHDRSVGRIKSWLLEICLEARTMSWSHLGLGAAGWGWVMQGKVLAGKGAVRRASIRGKGSVDASIQVGIDSEFVAGKSEIGLQACPTLAALTGSTAMEPKRIRTHTHAESYISIKVVRWVGHARHSPSLPAVRLSSEPSPGVNVAVTNSCIGCLLMLNVPSEFRRVRELLNISYRTLTRVYLALLP